MWRRRSSSSALNFLRSPVIWLNADTSVPISSSPSPAIWTSQLPCATSRVPSASCWIGTVIPLASDSPYQVAANTTTSVMSVSVNRYVFLIGCLRSLSSRYSRKDRSMSSALLREAGRHVLIDDDGADRLAVIDDRRGAAHHVAVAERLDARDALSGRQPLERLAIGRDGDAARRRLGDRDGEKLSAGEKTYTAPRSRSARRRLEPTFELGVSPPAPSARGWRSPRRSPASATALRSPSLGRTPAPPRASPSSDCSTWTSNHFSIELSMKFVDAMNSSTAGKSDSPTKAMTRRVA